MISLTESSRLYWVDSEPTTREAGFTAIAACFFYLIRETPASA